MIAFPPIKRGDTWKKRITFTLEGGITDCYIKLAIKKSKEDTDAQALVTLDSAVGGGITKVSSTAADFEISKDVTKLLVPGTRHVDIQFILPDDTAVTAKEVEDEIRVLSDVTRATEAPA